MSDSVRPHRRQPTRLPHPWDSPGKNTGVGCHFLLQYMKVKSKSEVAQSCPTLSNPMDCSSRLLRPWDFPGKSTIHKVCTRWQYYDRIKFELWCWRKRLQVPWTARRFNQSSLKEISPGVIGRTDVEAETLILWPPDVKSWLIWKDPDAGKDWRQEKGMTEDEMAGWHHRLNGHEFE